MDAMLIPVVMNSNALSGIYRDSDRGQYVQVSSRQYVIGSESNDKVAPVRVDLDKKLIFLRRDK